MTRDEKQIRKQKRVKEGKLPNPCGYRWTTPERKMDFLKQAREDEIAAKEASKES